jgi:hypothetical protein
MSVHACVTLRTLRYCGRSPERTEKQFRFKWKRVQGDDEIEMKMNLDRN